MKGSLLILLILISAISHSQPLRFSVATDLGIQRSFKKEQRFWQFGHTAHLHFNFNERNGVYAWLSYYSNGKFENELQATAKSPSTNPQQFNYTSHASMRFKHFSTGWKHYLKGTVSSDKEWCLYFYAGWGLMLGRIENQPSQPIDTTQYFVPVSLGASYFKRLTMDVGLGWEKPIGSDIFFYNEARLWLPTTDYPSKHILVNRRAPLIGSLNFGVRVMFN